VCIAMDCGLSAQGGLSSCRLTDKSGFSTCHFCNAWVNV
jgi:hypothetical protein